MFCFWALSGVLLWYLGWFSSFLAGRAWLSGLGTSSSNLLTSTWTRPLDLQCGRTHPVMRLPSNLKNSVSNKNIHSVKFANRWQAYMECVIQIMLLSRTETVRYVIIFSTENEALMPDVPILMNKGWVDNTMRYEIWKVEEVVCQI